MPERTRAPREDPEQQDEREVHDLERERFVALGAAGDRNLPEVIWRREERSQEPRNVFRLVFPVGVHRHDDLLGAQVGRDRAEPIDDGPLMAEVERRLDDGDVGVLVECIHPGVPTGRVVHEDVSDDASRRELTLDNGESEGFFDAVS